MDKPDNAVLVALLDINYKNRSMENANKIIYELQNGNSFLVIPNYSEKSFVTEKWEIMGKDSEFKWPIYKQHGLDVLPAFTDPNLMATWSKGKILCYSAMLSSDVLQLVAQGKAGNIDRILINPGSMNVFWLDRKLTKTDLYNFPTDGSVFMCAPEKPLNPSLLLQFQKNFEQVETISEVYQYDLCSKDKASIIIAIKLSVDSAFSRQAAQLAFEKSMVSGKFEQEYMYMRIIKDENEYKKVKGFENSLIYKRVAS
jgi:hypothetical protein